MITKLNICNFKCFQNQDIDFKKLTILAGANGVGKSSVIQALLLFVRYNQELGNLSENIKISLNDKKETYLELNNANEILNHEAQTSIISFQLFDSLGKSEIIEFETKESGSILKAHKKSAIIMPTGIILHYLNAERLGPRNIQDTESNKETVGFQGEFTGYIIEKALKNQFQVSDNKKFIPNETETTSPNIDRQIEEWINFILPDVEIQTKLFEEINKVRIGIRKKGTNTEFLHPNNIGFGISYVLPIIVTCLIAKEDDLVIIENPEAHLHPFSQSRVGQFLSKMAGAGTQIIVETHSEHVINGMRVGCLKNFINHSMVVVNFFSQKLNRPVNIEMIELNQNADLKNWPFGFFDQNQHDFIEIMELKKKKKK